MKINTGHGGQGGIFYSGQRIPFVYAGGQGGQGGQGIFDFSCTDKKNICFIFQPITYDLLNMYIFYFLELTYLPLTTLTTLTTSLQPFIYKPSSGQSKKTTLGPP